MAKQKSGRRKNRAIKFVWLVTGIMAALIVSAAVYRLMLAKQGRSLPNPDKLLLIYMDCIASQNYKEMYQMIDVEASGQISEEDFIKRNSAIYEGIEAQNMATTIIPYKKGAAGGFGTKGDK